METQPYPRHPFDSKATWTGSGLDQAPMAVFHLDDSYRDELKAALAGFKEAAAARGESPKWRAGHFFPTTETFHLPTLGPLLCSTRDELEEGFGAVLFKNFPLDCSEEDSVFMFCGLVSHIGRLQPQTVRGELLQPVQDEGQAELDERRGSKHNLGLPVHNDGCDVVGFLSRRRPRSGGTSVLVSAEAVHNAMRESHPEELAALYGNYHSAWQDYMYPEGRNSEATTLPRTWAAPVFSTSGGKLCCRYSRFYIDRAQTFPGVPKLSPLQLSALDTLDGYLNDAEDWQYRRDFDVGDVLFLNNHILLHSRTAFVDGETLDQRRQLYRAWMSMPNSRPLDESMACFFGNVEAGVARGGVKSEFMIDPALSAT